MSTLLENGISDQSYCPRVPFLNRLTLLHDVYIGCVHDATLCEGYELGVNVRIGPDASKAFFFELERRELVGRFGAIGEFGEWRTVAVHDKRLFIPHIVIVETRCPHLARVYPRMDHDILVAVTKCH